MKSAKSRVIRVTKGVSQKSDRIKGTTKVFDELRILLKVAFLYPKIYLHLQIQQGVHGPQAFAFCVVNINDEHTKPRLKKKLLKMAYGPTGIFAILLSHNGFLSNCPKTKFQTITSQIQFEKVMVHNPLRNTRQLFWV